MGQRERDESAFERRSKALFDSEVDGLDAQTRARLAQARLGALAKRRDSLAAWLSGPQALLAAGATAAAVAAFVVLWRLPSPEVQTPDMAALQDLEILLDEDALDMLEELDFYTWLEEQPEFSAPASADDDSVG